MFDSLPMFFGTLTVVLVFGGLIFFHELGHFVVARFFGMGVQTFSLGFGKALIKKKIGNTVYQIAFIPLGGFVSLVGEASAADIPEGFTEKDSFSLRPAWQRLLVIAAGAVFNLILALIICLIMTFHDGRPELLPQIGATSADSPAVHTGLQKDDTIISIDSNIVNVWGDIPTIIQNSAGKSLRIIIERNGQQLIKEITPITIKTHNIFGEQQNIWGIGITPSGAMRNVKLNFGEAIAEGFNRTGNMIALTGKVLAGLLKGAISADNLSGPIGITKVIYEESGKGITHILFIAAFISVNLGVLNLLPIPILDGGHIVFLLIEMLRRKPVPENIREKTSMVGLALLLGLMIFATYNDISRMGTTEPQKTQSSAPTNSTAP